MKTFFVIYRTIDGTIVRTSMTGPSPRDVAYEIRTRHRGVTIEAIKAAGDGRCKSLSRHSAGMSTL